MTSQLRTSADLTPAFIRILLARDYSALSCRAPDGAPESRSKEDCSRSAAAVALANAKLRPSWPSARA
jgi:hypothetical protein